MIERLYHKPKRVHKNFDEAVKASGEDFTLDDRKTSWCRQKLNQSSCLRRCLCCRPCRLSKEERMFAVARRQLQAELDIVAVLKKIRCLEAFYEHAKRSELGIDFDERESSTREVAAAQEKDQEKPRMAAFKKVVARPRSITGRAKRPVEVFDHREPQTVEQDTGRNLINSSQN